MIDTFKEDCFIACTRGWSANAASEKIYPGVSIRAIVLKGEKHHLLKEKPLEVFRIRVNGPFHEKKTSKKGIKIGFENLKQESLLKGTL